MESILYGVKYLFQYHCLKQQIPLINGLVLTNRCNLQCQQCKLADRGDKDLGYQEITGAVDSFYQAGGRCLYLQGGEPFLWHDRDHNLEDIVDYAHGVGYATVIIYTNGTYPLNTAADTVFVSVDGLEETHNTLRGNTFKRIMQNIQASQHPSLYINFTINNRNKHDLEGFTEYIKGIEPIRGIFFYFHTPYYGRDDLYIEPAERKQILQWLIDHRRTFNMLNSHAGLKSALRNDWKRPLGICSVYENGQVFQCCRYPDDPDLCRNCGYLSYAEIDQTLKLKPSAMWKALKYF